MDSLGDFTSTRTCSEDWTSTPDLLPVVCGALTHRSCHALSVRVSSKRLVPQREILLNLERRIYQTDLWFSLCVSYKYDDLKETVAHTEEAIRMVWGWKGDRVGFWAWRDGSTLPEDLSSILSTLMVVHNCLQLLVPGDPMPSFGLCGHLGLNVEHRCPCRQNIHTHNKIIKKKKIWLWAAFSEKAEGSQKLRW